MSFNRAQLIIFGSIGAIVLLALMLLTGVLPGLENPITRSFTIEVWGFRDPPGVWQEIANAFREEAERGATINYSQKDPQTYESELLDALASGKGPDVFLLQDSWIEKHAAKVKPLSDGELGYARKNLKTIFADGIAGAIADETGALLGTPLAFDSLALFYNRDYFNSANIPSPPRTWEELVEDAKTLTKFSEVGGIRRSGAALGTASNVAHAPDILMALVFQSGGEIIGKDQGGSPAAALRSPKTASALTFYAAFSDTTKRTYSWNAFFEDSIEAFAKGETAMAVGYARDVKKIADLNPQLNFDVAPLPQTGGELQVNFGRFDLLAVSRTSQESENAWRFLLWLQRKETEKQYIDLVGLPPARRDLVQSKPPRDWLQPFYDQVLSARPFPIAGDDSLPNILNDMIEAVATKRFTVDQAMNRAAAELNRVLKPRP
ncbi:MAG: hypothetical protein A3B37_01495 [Candidatus Sungbacteria bacterium RIFCSPLOWO2_01_FULL_59_16]|uniref:Sugar ABC transporter substrate-binding protein n=1 Tax=Candidatus Sungbacteria bacterium RIFCSPLOWO2_01_FULL_59_16 TaxID=1802280 RepID=A0A1G2LC33_9BACT|nr:MAG: hypothetical protein A3B37_01495 [Candidatus Sungbacteria bacterium RIFCSPLOWO2_01_FULL_59_16]